MFGEHNGRLRRKERLIVRTMTTLRTQCETDVREIALPLTVAILFILES
jgi:hypothetical protein